MGTKEARKEIEQTFLSETEYRKLLEALKVLTTILLFELEAKAAASSDSANSDRLRIIRNFLARGEVTLESILRLYEARSYGDCWTLFRTLLDRLFQLHIIAKNDEFAAFEESSFVRQYEMHNNILSDTSLTPEQRSAPPRPTEEHKSRYRDLKAKGVEWREPKPEDAARELGLMFLYKFAYDYASRFLHPTATDGHVEFEYVTQLGSKGDRGDQRLILHNSALIFTMLLNESLNATQLDWRSLIINCVEAFRKALTGEDLAYAECLARVAAARPEMEWSRSKPAV